MADRAASVGNRAWQRRGGNYRGQREESCPWDELPADVPPSVLDELRAMRELVRKNLDPTLTHFPADPKMKRIWVMWAIHV